MNGAERIAAERRRQVEAEGYTSAHDAGLPRDDLAYAGIAYAIAAVNPDQPSYAAGDWWPWGQDAWKPTGDRVRDLTKAGALIAAAIDAALPPPERCDMAAGIHSNPHRGCILR